MKQYNGEPYIVSFTSFGKRLASVPKMLFSLSKQTYKNFHTIFTIGKDSEQFITDELARFARLNKIEINVVDHDLGPHTKYYYAMLKYGNHPVITVDDDRFYAVDTISRLVAKYESLSYKSVVSNCAIEMQRDRAGRLLPYSFWISHRLGAGCRSNIAMAEGFAGVLYPANCFSNLPNELPGMASCKYDDDVYLKTVEVREHIPVTNTDYTFKYDDAIDIDEAMRYNLHTNQNAGNVNRDNMCMKFANTLLQAW